MRDIDVRDGMAAKEKPEEFLRAHYQLNELRQKEQLLKQGDCPLCGGGVRLTECKHQEPVHRQELDRKIKTWQHERQQLEKLLEQLSPPPPKKNKTGRK